VKTVIGIASSIRAGHQLASVFFSVGIMSLAATSADALPKDTVVATISTGNEYVGNVLVSPDSNHLYATNNDNKTIMVIDTGTNEVTSTISVGNLPFGLAISPDGGTLYVSNADDGTVSVIATATGRVTTTVAVGNFPARLAVSPDGKYVYVPNENDSTVSIIDTATDTVSVTIAVPQGADQVGFSQSGLNAYAASIGVVRDKGAHRPFLTVFDVSNQQIQSSIQWRSALGFYFAINPEGNEMYLIERDRIIRFNTVKNHGKGDPIFTPEIEFFGPAVAAVTPDGQYLYEPIGKSVYLVDVLNQKYVKSFSPGKYESSVAIAPNGKYGYFPDTLANDILVVDISSQ
jgi:YVTN family beta-propeller protein